MFEAGKTSQGTVEMRNYNLTVLGISDTKRTGSGQLRLATGELLLHSGYEKNAPHTQGVALKLSMAHWTEGTQTKNSQGHLPNQETEDECHPVLMPQQMTATRMSNKISAADCLLSFQTVQYETLPS